MLLTLLSASLFPTLCLVVMIMLLDLEWLVLLLVIDSGHRELVIPDLKAHSTSASIQANSF